MRTEPKTQRTPDGVNDNASYDEIISEEALDAISSEVAQQLTTIIQLKGRGIPVHMIGQELGLSRATVYRRIEQIKKLRSGNPKDISETVKTQIGEVLSFYMTARTEAIKLTGIGAEELGLPVDEFVSSSDKISGLRLALEAENQRVKFMFSLGFFDTYKAENKFKGDKALENLFVRELREIQMTLMDENYILRENLEAARNGRPEPHPDEPLKNWEDIFQKYKTDPVENNETVSEYDFSLTGI